MRLPLAALMLASTSLVACTQEPLVLADAWTPPPRGWTEVWRDDFNGEDGGGPDLTKWNVEVREFPFNDELQYNTDSRRNSFLDGSGNLVFQALKEPYVDAAGKVSAQPFSSARLNTQGKVEQMYGKFEARIKLPPGGRGVWPAFWMLGNDIASGWPECGEVDILEWRGSMPATLVSSLHGPGYSGGNSYHREYTLPAGTFSDDFHVFTFEWTEDGVRWLVDGDEYYVKLRDSIERSGSRWVFDHPFFVILNLAVGGIFDGVPDEKTAFPQRMLIDYVSVSRPTP